MLWLIRDYSEDALSLYLQCTNADWLVPVAELPGAVGAPTAAVGDGAVSKDGTELEVNKTRADVIRAAQTQAVAVRCKFTWIKNRGSSIAPIDFDVDHTFGPAAPMWGAHVRLAQPPAVTNFPCCAPPNQHTHIYRELGVGKSPRRFSCA
jgi:hypothetical protein